MSNRRLTAFIDALVIGRRPRRFLAKAEDVEVLRTAIALRAERPGDAIPDEQFVSDLYEKLADGARSLPAPNIRVMKMRRSRVALVGVAASAALVGGTAAATEAIVRTPAPATAIRAPFGTTLRTGTFVTAHSRVMGQIVAYRGRPSWIFMNVDGSNYTGRIVCELQSEDGSTVAVGHLSVHRGMGQFSRTIKEDISRLRSAKLITPRGQVVASATFI
ncbi:MAG TPA: hypothetical protein VKR27_03670 [Acidimicrobiales bacterium]|nr:hypothetical protein [Acidimicrobiales bacterium]